MDQKAKAVETTLELLKGPSDERRFVGLLLATKTLPAGDETALQKVYAAAGSTFFARLLLPLRRSMTEGEDAEERRKVAATVGLGLSMFAAFARAPSLASSADLAKQTPLLVKVVRCQGVSDILDPDILDPESSSDPDVVQLNCSAVQDSLEALTLIVEASEEARIAALEASGVEAVTVALQTSSVRKSWAVRLLLALLQGEEERLPTSAAAPKLVPILSLLLASRTKAAYTNSQVSAARGSTHAEGAQGTQGEMRKTDASSPKAANGSSHNIPSDPPTNPKAPSHKESEAFGGTTQLPGNQDSDSHLADDSAAQSLMIVHILLRLLPVAEGSKEEALLQQTFKASNEEHWSSAARQGLMVMLRAKLPPARRQAVLKLVAYYAQFTQSLWLLVFLDLLPSSFHESRAVKKVLTRKLLMQGDLNASFFTLVVELLRVEVTLLLRDALVPRPSNRTAEQHNSGNPSVESRKKPESPDTSRDEGSSSPLIQESRNGVAAELTQQAMDNERLERMLEPVEKVSGPYTAEARAVDGLPPMLQLFENCIEVLAQASDTEDKDMGTASEEGRRIPESVASRAMSSLTEIAEALLQYLEELQQQQREDLLAVAAVKGLSRFLADAPLLEEKRIRKTLPWLCSVSGGAGLPYLLPFLSQRLDHEADTKDRELWAAACLKAGVVQALSRAVNEVTAGHDAAVALPALYDPCLVLAWLLSYVKELDTAKVLRPPELTAVFEAATSGSTWAANCLRASDSALAASPDIDCRVLAFIGHICAFAASSQLEHERKTHIDKAFSSWMNCAFSALEVGDILLRSSFDKTTSAAAGLATLLSQQSNGAEHFDKPLPRDNEHATQQEEQTETVEPHIVAILQHCLGVCSTVDSVKKLAQSTLWWRAVSCLSISNADCQKSAYLRSLKPLIAALSTS